MATATKTVQIIARIAFKADPRKVCYIVRSSNGKDTYQTCLFNGKACSCSCPATKTCYHMIQLEAKEAARTAASTPAQVTPSRQQEDWSTPDGPLYKEVRGNSQPVAVDKAATFKALFKKYDVRQQVVAPMNNLYASQVEAIMKGEKVQVAPGAFCLAR